MNKPITVAREEFIENLANLINDSQLPMFVVEPILSGILGEVRNIARNQYKKDKADYEASVKADGQPVKSE